jgi:hypothetical protein
MQITSPLTRLVFLASAASALSVISPAQESAAVTADPQAEARYEVQSSRTVPDGSRNIIIQRVSPPVLPTPLPTLTPEQRAARRAAQPSPLQKRLLWLNVTAYGDGLFYIEWWPQNGRGGGSFCAWSRADFRYLSMAADFDIVSDDARYSVFPFKVQTYAPGRGAPPPTQQVSVPDDGSGFVLVKGDSSDKESINPVTALHQIYKEQREELKLAWEERERTRREAEAWRAANPPPPPGDAVIRFWPIKSQRYATQPAAAATTTDTDAANR